MQNNSQNNGFKYTYSAPQQNEIREIRKKYLPSEEDKAERVRRLDRSVTSRATSFALVIGVLSALVMGIGMCCVLVWQGVWFIPGIIIGLIGIAGVCVSYPTYLYVLRKERARIAPEILRLTDEILK